MCRLYQSSLVATIRLMQTWMLSLVSSVGCVGLYLMVLVCLPLSRISMHQQSSKIHHSHIRTNSAWRLVGWEGAQLPQASFGIIQYCCGHSNVLLRRWTSVVAEDLEYRKAIGRQKFRELRHAEVKRCSVTDWCNILETPAHLRWRIPVLFLLAFDLSVCVFFSLLSPPLSLSLHNMENQQILQVPAFPFLPLRDGPRPGIALCARCSHLKAAPRIIPMETERDTLGYVTSW